jgi:hypothetical protein
MLRSTDYKSRAIKFPFRLRRFQILLSRLVSHPFEPGAIELDSCANGKWLSPFFSSLNVSRWSVAYDNRGTWVLKVMRPEDGEG